MTIPGYRPRTQGRPMPVYSPPPGQANTPALAPPPPMQAKPMPAQPPSLGLPTISGQRSGGTGGTAPGGATIAPPVPNYGGFSPPPDFGAMGLQTQQPERGGGIDQAPGGFTGDPWQPYTPPGEVSRAAVNPIDPSQYVQFGNPYDYGDVRRILMEHGGLDAAALGGYWQALQNWQAPNGGTTPQIAENEMQFLLPMLREYAGGATGTNSGFRKPGEEAPDAMGNTGRWSEEDMRMALEAGIPAEYLFNVADNTPGKHRWAGTGWTQEGWDQYMNPASFDPRSVTEDYYPGDGGGGGGVEPYDPTGQNGGGGAGPMGGSYPGAELFDDGLSQLQRLMATEYDQRMRSLKESEAMKGTLAASPRLVNEAKLNADLDNQYNEGLLGLGRERMGAQQWGMNFGENQRQFDANYKLNQMQMELQKLGMSQDEAYRYAQLAWDKQRSGADFDMTKWVQTMNMVYQMMQSGDYTPEQIDEWLTSQGLPPLRGGTPGTQPPSDEAKVPWVKAIEPWQPYLGVLDNDGDHPAYKKAFPEFEQHLQSMGLSLAALDAIAASMKVDIKKADGSYSGKAILELFRALRGY